MERSKNRKELSIESSEKQSSGTITETPESVIGSVSSSTINELRDKKESDTAETKRKSKFSFLKLFPCIRNSKSDSISIETMSHKTESKEYENEIVKFEEEGSEEEEEEEEEVEDVEMIMSENEEEVLSKSEENKIIGTESAPSEKLNIESDLDPEFTKLYETEKESADPNVEKVESEEAEVEKIESEEAEVEKIESEEAEMENIESESAAALNLSDIKSDKRSIESEINNKITDVSTISQPDEENISKLTTKSKSSDNENLAVPQDLFVSRITSQPTTFKIGADTIEISAARASPIDKVSQMKRSIISIRMQPNEAFNQEKGIINIQVNEVTAPKKRSSKKVKFRRGSISADLNDIMTPLIDPRANVVILTNPPLITEEEDSSNINILPPIEEQVRIEDIVKTYKPKNQSKRSTIILPTHRADVTSYESKDGIENERPTILAIPPSEIPQHAAISEHIEEFSAIPDVEMPLVLIAPSPIELERQKRENLESKFIENPEEHKWREIAEEIADSLPTTIKDQPMVIVMPHDMGYKCDASNEEKEEIQTVVIVPTSYTFPEQNLMEEEANQMFFSPIRETPTIVLVPSNSDYNIIKVNAESICSPYHEPSVAITSQTIRIDVEESRRPLYEYPKGICTKDWKTGKKDPRKNYLVKEEIGSLKCYGYLTKKPKTIEDKDFAMRFPKSFNVHQVENYVTNKSLKSKNVILKKSIEKMKSFENYDNVRSVRKVESKICIRIDNHKIRD